MFKKNNSSVYRELKLCILENQYYLMYVEKCPKKYRILMKYVILPIMSVLLTSCASNCESSAVVG